MKQEEILTRGSREVVTKGRLWDRVRQIGPALVLAAVVLGPGSITLSTIAGSTYGYRLLWVLMVGTIFMISYTLMAARIGLVTRQSLFTAARHRFGSLPAVIGGVSGFLAIIAFQAGNNAAVGFSAEAVLGIDSRLGAILFFLPALGLILLPGLYQKLELLVKIVIGLMVLGFVGTLLIVGIQTDQVLPGLVPRFPDEGSVFLALGMVSTTFSIAAAAYQCHLMKEKNWGPEQLEVEGLDSVFGIAILGGISIVVLLTSAGVIAGTDESGFSAQAMALQLEPLVGPAAFYLFMCGFFFASFSSLIVNPLIGATLLADGLGKNPSMDGKPVKFWATVAMLLGTGVVVVFGGSPIELLRTAQAMAVVAFPVLGFLVLFLAGDRKTMGEHRNGITLWVLGVLGYLTIVAIVLNYLRQIVQAL